MHAAGYIASALIGFSLGLIGGGGSILTVPVLVYLFELSPVIATSYSLFIVGSTSLVGALNSLRQEKVSIKTAALFGMSSILTVYLTRKFIISLIPEKIFSMHNMDISESMLIMILFALLMVFAAFSMILDPKKENTDYLKDKKLQVPRLLIYGLGIGLITGLLGAGGGFMLIPALVILVGLPMKEAVGTSLLIIALNSLVGFTGDIGHFQFNYLFLLTITGIAVAGVLIGGTMSRKIPGNSLKKGFGWFVLGMGLFVILKETFLKKTGSM